MFSEREQIINYLLQQCDAKNREIEVLKTQRAELEKSLSAKKES